MPCQKCEDGKWKWGATGKCKYNTQEECEKENKGKAMGTTRGTQIKQFISGQLLAVCPSYLDSILATLNSGDIAKMETSQDIAESHGYEEKGNIAIITVDGAMIKKNNFFNAMCGGFVPYDAIALYIDKAEQNENIDTIIFNVDTVGGMVSGADELGEKIFNSSKKTVTFYNNVGASAGIWVFSGTDKRYASKTTILGSIGVKASYMEQDGETDEVVLVSKNAKNKDCSLNGDCIDKIQSRIDKTEDIFYERVVRNTGLSKEVLASSFKYGDVISADEAKEVGFIDEVISFDILIKSLVNEGSTNSVSDKPAKFMAKEQTMPEEKEIRASQLYKDLEASNVKIAGDLEALQASHEKTISELNAMKEQNDKMVAAKETFGNDVAEIVAMGYSKKVSQDTMVAMVQAGSLKEAKVALVDGTVDDQSVFGAEEEVVETEAKAEEQERAFASMFAKRHDIRKGV